MTVYICSYVPLWNEEDNNSPLLFFNFSHTKLQFCLLFYVDVKLDLSCKGKGKNILVFEIRVLRLDIEEVTGKWSKLHNEELHNCTLCLNIIRVMKSRSMVWVGCVLNIGET
jgi:hypothetical protein